MSTAAIAMIGDNNPPEAIDDETPFDKHKKAIEDLYSEAKNLCDGEPINSQALADSVESLVVQIKAEAKAADADRVKENKPFDDGKKAVQAKYNPLIQKDKGKADLAIKACNQLLTPWKQKLADELAAEQERQRKEAEETRRLAAEKMQAAAKTGDLAAKEEAEKLDDIAKYETKQANRTARETVKGMRTVRAVKLVDARALARWFWDNKFDELTEFMLEKAKQYDRNGQRGIAGIEVTEERVAR